MKKERNRAPFATFGSDVKEARKALGYTQKTLAEAIGIAPRYLANIENSASLPSLPVFYEIVRLCKLPIERYFHPETAHKSRKHERIGLKLSICPETYLPIIESVLDAALELNSAKND